MIFDIFLQIQVIIDLKYSIVSDVQYLRADTFDHWFKIFIIHSLLS